MKDVSFDTLIIQYCNYNGISYYNSDRFGAAAEGMDQVASIFKAAEETGINVFVGLALDEQWWSSKFSGEYLSDNLAKNLAIIDEIYSTYHSHQKFAGWYIPHEVDDYNYNDAAKEKALHKHLKAIAEYARKKTPDKPISLSPYYSMTLSPEDYRAWWRRMLVDFPVDIIMLQDGVGCRRCSVEKDVPTYYSVLHDVCAEKSIAFWNDLETFDQIHAPYQDGQPWAAIPAPLDRIKAQLRAASPFVEKTVMFEFTHYLSPQMGEAQKALFTAYKNALMNGEIV